MDTTRRSFPITAAAAQTAAYSQDSDVYPGPKGLHRLIEAIEHDVAKELYDGAVVVLAQRGSIVLHEAIGFAHRASGRRAQQDDVFALFSVTKTFTAAAVLACVDRGEIMLTTPVAEIIPEFAVRGKQRVTIGNLLTHTGGMSAGSPPVAPEKSGDLAEVVAAVCEQPLEARPGSRVRYSPLTAHAMLGEVVRRLDGGRRPFREILHEDFFKPLGMRDTSLGLRPDLADRRVPTVVRDQTKGLFNAAVLEGFNTLLREDTEIPAAGAVSTAADILRWAEMLRRGGELDGARVLSPAIIELAVTNHTGAMPNDIFDYAREMYGWPDFPAYLGLGFFLRGDGMFPTYFGLTASPGTFGGIGAGSTVFWVDRKRELTFVCLTAGLVEEGRSTERFQRLSDLVIAGLC
jgi:CubicO group peptidase (beta-lactamase class C family)